MKNISAVFFDNDGVLVHTEPLYCRANTETLATLFPEKNIVHTEKEFKDYVVLSNKGSRRWMQERGCSDEDIQAFRVHRDALYLSFLAEENCAVTGAYETLQALRPHFRLALTTASERKNFEYVHRNTGMRAFFEFEITREDVQVIKPDPEIYLKALDQAGLSADQAVVIEDTPRGVAAAKSAEIFTIAVPNEFTRGLDFSAADVVLENISEVPGVLGLVVGS